MDVEQYQLKVQSFIQLINQANNIARELSKEDGLRFMNLVVGSNKEIIKLSTLSYMSLLMNKLYEIVEDGKE